MTSAGAGGQSNSNTTSQVATSILMATLSEQLDKYNDSMYNFNPMRGTTTQVQTEENFLDGLDSDGGISLADLDSITLLPLAGHLGNSNNNSNSNNFVESETFMGWSTQEVLSNTTTSNYMVSVTDMAHSPASYSSSPAFNWESSCNDYLGSPATSTTPSTAGTTISSTSSPFDSFFQVQLQQQQQQQQQQLQQLRNCSTIDVGEFFLPELDYNDVMDRSLAKFVGEQ